jgi:chromosome partitioning protein
VVPAHIDLSAVEMALAGKQGREAILRRRIEAEPRCGAGGGNAPAFDYLVVDCPPSLGLLSLNAMAAVDEVLLPLQPHFLALHGLSKLLETIELVSEHVNPRLRLLGVVLCMQESGTRLAHEVGRDVKAFFEAAAGRHPAWSSGRLFETRIRRNIRLAEAPSFGQSIFDYAPDSHGAEDYAALAEEVDQAAAVGRDDVRRVA